MRRELPTCRAPKTFNRCGRRHAGGTWASTSAERELDDALLRMVAKAAELPASMRRKAVLAPALCRALLVRSRRDSSGPPSPVLMSSSCSWFQHRARRYAAPAHRICFGSDECSSTHSACLPAAAGHTAVWLRFAPERPVSSSPAVKGGRRSLPLPLEANDPEASLQEHVDAPTVGLAGADGDTNLLSALLHLEAARQPPRRWSLGVDKPCQIRAQGHSLCVTATQSPSHRAGMSSYRCRLVSGG